MKQTDATGDNKPAKPGDDPVTVSRDVLTILTNLAASYIEEHGLPVVGELAINVARKALDDAEH